MSHFGGKVQEFYAKKLRTVEGDTDDSETYTHNNPMHRSPPLKTSSGSDFTLLGCVSDPAAHRVSMSSSSSGKRMESVKDAAVGERSQDETKSVKMDPIEDQNRERGAAQKSIEGTTWQAIPNPDTTVGRSNLSEMAPAFSVEDPPPLNTPIASVRNALRPSPAQSTRSTRSIRTFWMESDIAEAGHDSDNEQETSWSGQAPSIRSSLPRAVRKGRWSDIKKILERPRPKTDVREVLMARHIEGGCGLLMLAAKAGKADVLPQLADEIQEQLGTAQLVKQLREDDEEKQPLLFYSVASDSKSTFTATHKLLRKTVGSGGLDQQLQQKDAKGRNVLMHAARGGEEGVWTEVWKMLEKRDLLYNQLEASDRRGKGVYLYAAEAGNTALVRRIIELDKGLENTTDDNGWNGFMYAARGSKGEKALKVLFELLAGDQEAVKRELTEEAKDGTFLLLHAAIGGSGSFATVRRFMSAVEGGFARHPEAEEERVPVEARLLSWAAQGGGIKVLSQVADGIKANRFEEGMADQSWFNLGTGSWYDVGNTDSGGAERLKAAVIRCAKTGGESLFISAIESGKPELMRAVVKGIHTLSKDPEQCWYMLCGFPGEHEGNPLSLAASKSVALFKETLKALEEECDKDENGEFPKIQAKLMPADDGKLTPLYGAVCSNDTVLFDEVLAAIKKHFPDVQPTGRQIIEQVEGALNVERRRSDKQWISAIMLPKVLKAARDADRVGGGYLVTPYDISLLDGAVKTAVSRDAFDHLRTLAKSGCNIVKQLPELLSKIGDGEKEITEFVLLAVTAARNPFVVCAVALENIRDSEAKYPMNRGALKRLQDSLVALMLELLDHLPRSVYDVGAELARGDPDMRAYNGRIGRVDPRELLGFIVVRWMLERSAEPSRHGSGKQPLVRIPLLVHAVSTGTDFLDLLSAPLVVDYLRLEFTRTLPTIGSKDPFERNINQVFYSYTMQSRDSGRDHPLDLSQRLLQLLQGWYMDEMPELPHRTVLPGLQFILAGIMGKPGAFYPVPAVRMFFDVLCYVGMMGLYLSSVQLSENTIPMQERLFYLFMAGTVCREALEFANAKKSVHGPPSVERYFSDAWNILDVATIFIVATAFVLRVNQYLSLAQLFLAISAPLLFSRVLFLSQIGSALGPMTQVIFTMLRELTTFSVVLVLVMVGFATCFTALFGSGSIYVQEYEANLEECELGDHPVHDSFGDFARSLLTLFAAMLGDFDFEVFDDSFINEMGIDCGGIPYRAAGVALLVVYLVIMAVMLLNLLIAVLSTAHFEVYKNADKQFHLARAKLILQSRDDVLHDALPPPFSLIKPILGLAWPVGLLNEDVWEITLRTINRFTFAVVVGLTAVVISTLLWIASIPWVAWTIAGSMARRTKRSADENDSNDTSRHSSPPVAQEDSVHGAEETGWNGHSVGGPEGQDGGVTNELLERVFFLASDRERLTWRTMRRFVVVVCGILFGTIAAGLLCFIVYPTLSLLLWIRGICSLFYYIKASRSPNMTPWLRKQMGLGEEGEEWDSARKHAMRKNESYRNGKANSDDFNVAALLTTTTGMTMDDLREKSSIGRGLKDERDLAAALEEILVRFSSNTRRSVSVYNLVLNTAERMRNNGLWEGELNSWVWRGSSRPLEEDGGDLQEIRSRRTEASRRRR